MMIEQHPSPNFNERNLPVSMLVMHYTGMRSGSEALARLSNKAAQVSAHYLIEEDGRIFQLVDEAKRAWHAGQGGWGEVTDVNSASIGIEIVNPGHEFGYRPFPERQMHAVLQLSQAIVQRHAIDPHNIVGHADIAPSRKQDPGELFDWQWLASHHIGLWPVPPQQHDIDPSVTIACVPLHTDPTQQLRDYGYHIPDSPTLSATITAFQRHFHPQSLTGKWNTECAARLASLLNMRYTPT